MSKPKLNNADFCRAAKQLGCEVAAIKAVAEQESKQNGFDLQGRPIILFEHAVFRKYTKGKYDNSHPDISRRGTRPYGSTSIQWDRFNEAFALDQKAAMLSASYGKFQVMGFNYAVCGFTNIKSFFDAMHVSEGKHLDAFCEFVETNNLADELRRHDWAGFARGYNGAGYKENAYDTKIAASYKKFAKENIDCSKDSAADTKLQQVSDTLPAVNPPEQPAVTTNEPPPIDSETTETVTKESSIVDKFNALGEKTTEISTKVQSVSDTVSKVSASSFWTSVLTKIGGWFLMLWGIFKDNWEIIAVAMVLIIAALVYLNYAKSRAQERALKS